MNVMYLVGSCERYNKEYPTLRFKLTSAHQALAKQKKITCDCCGFQSRLHRNALNGFMEVLELKGIKSLYCCLCAASQSIGRTIANDACHGTIMYAPEVSQGQVIDLYRTIVAIRLLGTQFVDDNVCQRAFDLQGKLQKLTAGEIFQPIFKDSKGSLASMLGILENASAKVQRHHAEVFSGLRYLPRYDIGEYQEAVKYWLQANPGYFTTILKKTQ